VGNDRIGRGRSSLHEWDIPCRTRLFIDARRCGEHATRVSTRVVRVRAVGTSVTTYERPQRNDPQESSC